MPTKTNNPIRLSKIGNPWVARPESSMGVGTAMSHRGIPFKRAMALQLFCLCVAAFCSGCQLTGGIPETQFAKGEWNSSFKKKSDAKVEYGQPERMAVIWTDTTASANGVADVRGFGGRIYFYDKAGNPTRVDGELSIYAFDDTTDEQKMSADRVYKFRQEEWQGHFSETQLGPSYSIWLPWDKVGGDRKTIALMPIFKSADKSIVKSGQSINVLNGKTPPLLAETPAVPFRVLGSSPSVAQSARAAMGGRTNANYGVQLVSNTESAATEEQPIKDRTTTIDVPRQMVHRMNQDLDSGTVESVTSGMTANVSFDPRVSASSPGSADSSLGANRGTTASATTSDANANSTPPSTSLRPQRRAVFGAPGALK